MNIEPDYKALYFELLASIKSAVNQNEVKQRIFSDWEAENLANAHSYEKVIDALGKSGVATNNDYDLAFAAYNRVREATHSKFEALLDAA